VQGPDYRRVLRYGSKEGPKIDELIQRVYVDHISSRELGQYVGAMRAPVITESLVASRTRGLIADQTAGDLLRPDTTAQAAV
jgi:hypothetical protein